MFGKKLLSEPIVIFLTLFFITSCGGGSTESGSSPQILERETPKLTTTSEEDSRKIMLEPDCEDLPSETIIVDGQVEVEASIKRCIAINDELDRIFYIFIPKTYSNTVDYQPLLFSLHGYGSTAVFHMRYTGFKEVASKEGFIAIFPQGSILKSAGTTHWNVGGWTRGSTSDDVGFINDIIDFMTVNYRIDTDRIYSTGMSNGGFMSYHLACNLSEKIAAVASVTGSMTPETYNSCEPDRPISIMQIHGSHDEVVPYLGNQTMKSIDEVMDYWRQNNRCNEVPEIQILPDLTNDKLGGSQTSYLDCQNDTEIILYLLDGLAHRWPLENEADVDAPSTIWQFLSRYDRYGRIFSQ
ncbi:MAG: hypothetical protein CMP95_04410 [Gammaproteobacteria bacterium]|nr:hypothetical protein [Gammaproteobacteria bacterium]